MASALATNAKYDSPTPIACLADYFNLVSPLHTNILSGPTRRYYFRGQTRGNASHLVANNSKHWPIISSLARPDASEKLLRTYESQSLASVQTYLVERLKRLSEHFVESVGLLPAPEDYLSWLTIAQHFGLPTFLMDWSLNPLVALYFACDDAVTDERYVKNGRIAKRHGQDGYVFGMDILTKEERRSLPGVKDKACVIHLEIQAMRAGLSPDDMNSRNLELEIVAEIQKQVTISHPLVVVPRLLTRRIDVQGGRFIYWHSNIDLATYTQSDLECAPRCWNVLKPIAMVPRNKKVQILEELITYRIHPGTMMADMDGYSKFLRWGGL